MAKTKTMGKGLSALLQDAPETHGPSLRFIKIKDIETNPLNPRKSIDEESLDELTASIFRMGVIQPITVRPKGDKYELICGERRYRAALKVNTAVKDRDTIPASVRELSDQEAMEVMITENLQRKYVHPLEEAEAFQFMIDKMNYQVVDIAAKIGKNDSFVVRRLQLLKLVPDLAKLFVSGDLNIGHAELLSRVNKESQDLWYMDKYSSNWDGGQGTIQNLKRWLKDKTENLLKDAPFKIDAAFEGAQFISAKCTECPQNSSCNNTLFPDTIAEATCHNPHCYRAKKNYDFHIQLKSALNDPTTILINEGYSDNEVSKKLKADGFTVLAGWDAYTKLERPKPYKFAGESEADFKIRQDRIVKNYVEQLPSAVKAFDIFSGKTIDVILKNLPGAKIENKTDLTRKKLEVDVEMKKLRGKELDQEKIMTRLVDHMKQLPLLKEANSDTISETEMDCLLALAFDHNGAGEEVTKLLRVDRYGAGPTIVEAIAKASAETRALIVRKSIFWHYCSINPRGLQGGVIFHLAKLWCPDELKAFEEEQAAIRERREAKLDQKIKEFNKTVGGGGGGG